MSDREVVDASIPKVTIDLWRADAIVTDVPGVTQDEIDRARDEVARDMGW